MLFFLLLNLRKFGQPPFNGVLYNYSIRPPSEQESLLSCRRGYGCAVFDILRRIALICAQQGAAVSLI